jgi:hypothetical protein
VRAITDAHAAVLALPHRTEFIRVRVQDAGGAWQDLTVSGGVDWLDEVSWSGNADKPCPSATVILKREVGKALSMAPLMVDSALNHGFDPAAAYSPLIADNRGVKIEAALMPFGTKPENVTSGDWAPFFTGVIDSHDAGAGDQMKVEIRGLARRMALPHGFIRKERVYAYAAVSGSPVSLRIWEPSTAYVVGEYLIPSSANLTGYFYKCTTAGTSGTTEPAWTVLGPWSDGGAVWTYQDATSTAGFAIEAVIQNMLDDNLGAGAVVLYCPTSPSFPMSPWKQGREELLGAISKAAIQAAGSICRYQWRAATSQEEFTFITPNRAAGLGDVVRTFTADDYEKVTKLQVDGTLVRNNVDCIFSDASDLDPERNPVRKPVNAQDPTSIAAHGDLFMELTESSASHIDSSAKASAFAAAAVADLKEPGADQSIDFTDSFLFAELGDYYTFAADNLHYSTDQQRAVYGFTHTARGGTIRTSIDTRGKPSIGVLTWIRCQAVPSLAGRDVHQMQLFGTLLPPVITASPMVGGAHLEISITPDKLALPIEHEFHLSKTAGFEPDSTTLVAVGSQRTIDIGNLIPGEDYKLRTIQRGRNDSKIVRGLPGPELSFTAGRASAGHIISRLDTSRKPLNGSFETRIDPTGLPDYWQWTGGGTSSAALMIDGNAAAGTNYMRLINDAGHEVVLYSALYEVRGGANYRIDVWHKAATAPSTFFFYAVWYDQTATEDDHSTGVLSTDRQDFDAATAWACQSFFVPVPSGARFGRIAVHMTDAASRTVYIDNVRSEEQLDVFDLPAHASSHQYGGSDPLTPEAWIGVSGGIGFANSWVNYGPGYPSAAYCKDAGGFVHLTGLVKSGTVGATIFTLPAGYRPSNQLSFACVSNSAFGQLVINSSGTVFVYIGNNTSVSLDGVTFDTR